jgi:dGTPase
MPLAPYAITDANSKGRRFGVVETADRNQFQRDYTRVLHSQAFRRLQQKTQVFSANLGDLFRTRITHSLEVDQVSRSVAQQLGLNEDLCGVLAIAHDIGHAPFGHMGQDLLDELMAEHGGFEHNLQALRLVDEIECPYPEHRGLNLTFETREGLLKHCSQENARQLGEVAARHLDGRPASLEAQVVDWCDAVAYVHADLEDAFLMGVLSAEKMRQVPGYLQAWERIASRMPTKAPPTSQDIGSADPETQRVAQAVVRSIIRDMMAHSLKDLVADSRLRLRQANPQTPEQARQHQGLIGFSPGMLRQHIELKKFSRQHIYSHPNILEVRKEEEKILRGLFCAFQADPSLLPGPAMTTATPGFYRRLADHLSGMTDRYAVDVFDRLKKERPEIIPEAFHDASQTRVANEHSYPKPVVERGRGWSP